MLDSGTEVLARPVDAGAPGSRCLVAVRPERVAVAAILASEMGEDALSARLVEVIFQGDHVRLRLSLGDGAEVVAKRPVGAGMLPEPGTLVSVAWDPAHAHAFAAEG
ncbi:TOBE domain-containing protein [Teichococcus aestuarii]